MALASIHVALLRAVNVGSKRKVPMADLIGVFEDAGAESAKTYIQSGNVLFRPPSGKKGSTASLATFIRTVEAALLARFGFAIPVVVRTQADLVRIVRDNPFLARGLPPEKLHLGFLGHAPAEERVARFDTSRSPGDEAVISGAELYLHMPNGVGNSKLTTPWLEKSLGTTVTVRNWRTVTALAALATAAASG
ncbi:MAG: DUF1697 domain-containing protein [Polyangiaceae bacterium]